MMVPPRATSRILAWREPVDMRKSFDGLVGLVPSPQGVKAGRHHLRQIGLALLVARQSRLPLFWRSYPGNLHDSRLFAEVMPEMFGMVTQLEGTKQRLTVVVDKGMNSEENFQWLDDHPRMHFVITYSPHYLEDLMTVPLDQVAPIEVPRNYRLAEAGRWWGPGTRRRCANST